MRITVSILILLSISISAIIGQVTYPISVNDRNDVIELTKNAILDIDNKEFTKAFEKLRKSIEIDSLFREPYLRVYQIYSLNKENTEETIEILKKGKRIYEDDDELFFYCGEVYRLNDMLDEAYNEYSSAIEYSRINGEDFYLVPFYYLNRGNLLLASEMYESAINDYSYLLKLDSTSASGLTNRGIAYYKLGENEKACQDWEKAIKNGFEKANDYFQKHCKD